MRTRTVLALLTVACLLGIGTGPAVATGGSHSPWHRWFGQPTVHQLHPWQHGNPEGVAWHERSLSFFVGSTADGTISRGRLWERKIRPFIRVHPSLGRSAIGLEAVGNRLYVAGGATGKLFVYDLRSRRLVGTFDTGTGGFLNDVMVRPNGHVYVTDSFRPVIWHVTAAQVVAGTGAPTAIDVGPEITYVPGEFNLNGIEWFGPQEFLTIQSATGLLYRVRLDPAAPGGRTITQLAAPPVVGGDGIAWDARVGHLVIVDGDPAALHFMKLKTDLSEGVITKVRTDPSLRGPSTIARAWHRYLVVNADFATSTPPFTVSALQAPWHDWYVPPADSDGEWLDDLKMRH